MAQNANPITIECQLHPERLLRVLRDQIESLAGVGDVECLSDHVRGRQLACFEPLHHLRNDSSVKMRTDEAGMERESLSNGILA